MLAAAAMEAVASAGGTATTGTLRPSLGAPPVRTGMAVSLTKSSEPAASWMRAWRVYVLVSRMAAAS